MLKKWFSFPTVRAGAVFVLALALVLAFPSTRALAGEFLNLFRVQQVTILPIDSTGLENLTGNEALGSQLSELISSSTVVLDEPDEPVYAANAEEASAAAGFTVRLPSGLTPSNIYVTDSSAFMLTVDRDKAQALLDGAGRSDLVLPEALDGAEITVSIPASVSASFDACPEPQTEKSGEDPYELRMEYPDCIILSQMTSPVVNAPDGVDVAELARVGLEFTGMTREEAEAFTQSVDWMTTLVVPLPRDAATHYDVSVDGVTGTLIQRISEYSPEYVLLWVKDGIVYVVSGTGTDADRALEIANSLP